MAPNLNFGVFPRLGWQISTGSRRSGPRVSPEMNDSDLVLIRTSNFLGIGSLRKKLQLFKDHSKTQKNCSCNENFDENREKSVQQIMVSNSKSTMFFVRVFARN